jgi:hypothetical protein
LNNDLFDRPLIIVAAPRSGSSFLFELLTKLTDFYTIGGESHTIIEGISKFNFFTNHELNSNVLTAKDIDQQSKKLLLERFTLELRDKNNNKWITKKNRPSRIRFLEKTPKNALRIEMLLEVFPDAQFIYLYRDPKSNISSIIDAWDSGKFVTYPKLEGRDKPWSLLLPEDWQNYSIANIEEIATFQWQSTNQTIIDKLSALDENRYLSINYTELRENTELTIQKISDFCQIEADFLDLNIAKSTQSSYTLTAPKEDKWKKNSGKLYTVLLSLRETVKKIKAFAPHFSDDLFDISIKDSDKIDDAISLEKSIPAEINRNTPCFCKSGKRFKHCHGIVR